MATLDEVQTEIDANQDTTQSAVTLLDAVITFLQNNIGNSAALTGFVNELSENRQALAAAVANTQGALDAAENPPADGGDTPPEA